MRCVFCNSERVVKAGKRKRKYITKQQWRCLDCKRWFIEHDGFEGMTYPKEVILETLRLYVKGLPLNKIIDFMYQHRGYKIYGSRILDWARKYSKLVKKLEKQVKPKVKRSRFMRVSGGRSTNR